MLTRLVGGPLDGLEMEIPEGVFDYHIPTSPQGSSVIYVRRNDGCFHFESAEAIPLVLFKKEPEQEREYLHQLVGAAQACLHQLSTDSDLDSVSRPDRYHQLVEALREALKPFKEM